MSATITGSTLDGFGNPISTEIDFTSLSTPLVLSGGIINPTATVSTVSDCNGNFSVVLLAGLYQVNVNSSETSDDYTFNILVPSSGTYTIDEVVTASVSPAPYVPSGTGSPQGVVTANPGATYFDVTGGGFWVKATGTDNNGWVQLINL